MIIKSINPYNATIIAEYPVLSDTELEQKIQNAHAAYKKWRVSSFEIRSQLLISVANLLHEQMHELAELCTLEMGKPISQGYAEIEKCAWLCEFYAEKAEEMLKPEMSPTEATWSGVQYQALGAILGIMPWNFPFWQALRFAIPAIAAGNSVLLKHASNVSGCALAMEKLLEEAGAENGLFSALMVPSSKVEAIIAHPTVRGVSFTGSDSVGSIVASQAGKYLKPCVLELGGSNPFVVLEDARLDFAIAGILAGRFQNNGQSCIAAKRILIQDTVFEYCFEQLESKIRNMKHGNPLEPEMEIGPLAKPEFAEELYLQMKASETAGARIVCGGRVESAFFTPALMIDVKPGMPVFDEETFGPLLAISTFKTLDEAIELSNNSRYGLGMAVFTSNPEQIESKLPEIEQGSVFINNIVKSDPRLPFGGIKDSGYGRELGRDGLLSFSNRQTFVVY